MSLQNTFVTRVALPLIGNKRHWSTAEGARRLIARAAARPASHVPPRSLRRRTSVSLRSEDGWPVYEIFPPAAPGARVLYLHGGSYINEITAWHWRLAAGLARRAGAAVTVPIYPLGASLGAAGTVAGTARLATRMLAAGGPPLVLMGDSAGGGLALAAAQALRDQGTQPARLVLISPWLDARVGLPEQRELERRDAMLGIDGARVAAQTYACGLPLEDPRLSPLLGELAGLPPITVFAGSEDLLFPDARRLKEACTAAGVPCELVQGPGMPHVWPLLPTPEGRDARRRIEGLLRASG